MHFKEAQAGHFMPRNKMSTRWDEMNVQVQCYGCNIAKSGNQYVFGKRLDIEYENGIAEYLENLSNGTRKFSVGELEQMGSYYQSTVNDLMDDLGLA